MNFLVKIFLFLLVKGTFAHAQTVGIRNSKQLWGIQKAADSHVLQRDTIQTRLWLENIIHQLRSGNGFGMECQWVEPSINTATGFERVSYRLREGSCISFKNGKNVRFKVHSSHEDARVGDVVLAIEEGGGIWVNFSHICGGIIHFIHEGNVGIKTGPPQAPADSGQFFEYFVCDTDDRGWEFFSEN